MDPSYKNLFIQLEKDIVFVKKRKELLKINLKRLKNK